LSTAARIRLPKDIRRGDLVEVQVIIQHPMETGFRRDASGQHVRRNAIHSFACRYNGVEVFRATLGTGIAANPYLRFFTRAVDSGELELWWLDDDEVEGTAREKIVVTG
jgi:sulfur-oxidizing protein SoxZ